MDHLYQEAEGFKISCDGPNPNLEKFSGSLDSVSVKHRGGKLSLSNDNIVFRGMSLRNTEEIIGLVLYSGKETKIQKNTASTKNKTSKIMRLTNHQIGFLLLLQITLSVIGSAIGSTWMFQHLDLDYMHFTNSKWETSWILNFIKTTGTWILIFTNLVPISLLVTLDLVKLWQATFMEYDLGMFDQTKFQGGQMEAHCSDINEELG